MCEFSGEGMAENGPELVKEIVPIFLKARFLGNDPGEERHARRVEKVRKLEQENQNS